VVAAAGPWLRQGEWWTAADIGSPNGNSLAANSWHDATPLSYERDYYELALADGGVYRVYYDLYSGKWFVDGIYD
jgi:hypothetical protein